jgi:hypothetical protein
MCQGMVRSIIPAVRSFMLRFWLIKSVNLAQFNCAGIVQELVKFGVLGQMTIFSLRRYISISNLGFSPLYMINVYGTNPTTQKTE